MEQLDEASLEKRLEAQKELVARLISEGRDAVEANRRLYELSKVLDEIKGTKLPTHPARNQVA
jgi:hypothetical protein